MKNCQQCGEKLNNYYQFYVCSSCYTKNVMQAQRKLLAEDKK